MRSRCHPDRACSSTPILPPRQSVLLPSMQLTECLLQIGYSLHHRSIPEDRSGLILPVRMRRVENRFVPVHPFLDATIRLRFGRPLLCKLIQRAGYGVLGVPKPAHALVRNSRHRASARRLPIRREDRLPNNQNAHLPLRVARQKLLHCGGPPQTYRSSGREKQHQSRHIGVAVKRILEAVEICTR